MDKNNEGLKEESTEDLSKREILLVISIDKNGKIIKFNKDCEKITGYSRYEALNKEFFDFLIPDSYFGDWGKLFDLARRNEVINNLKLPWMTREGQEVKISWSGYPVEKAEGEIEEICLIGKLIDPDFNLKENFPYDTQDKVEDTFPYGTQEEVKEKDSIIDFIKDGLDNKRDTIENVKTDNREEILDKTDKTTEDNTIFYLGNKRIIFKKNIPASPRKTSEAEKKKISPKKEGKIKPIKTRPVETKPVKIQPAEIKPTKTTKVDKIDETYKPPVESYYDFNKIIKDLQKKNNELEKENKKLEKNFNALKIRLSNIKKDKKSKASTMFDFLKGGDKKDEMESIINELDERKIQLDNLETQLISEKEDIQKQKDEFVKWRGKLELLEEEIEKRRKELVEQEKEFSDRFVSSLDEQVEEKTIGIDDGFISEIKTSKEITKKYETLDKIPASAAIIQRGILKQVNHPFVKLLGYNIEEIVEKSLLDFIVQEGLSGIERYYLNRLKGESTSSFETVFLTKDDNKLAVEVNIKPTIFKDMKADIAVFNIASGDQEISAVDEINENSIELTTEEPTEKPMLNEGLSEVEKAEEPLKEEVYENELTNEETPSEPKIINQEEKSVEESPPSEKTPEPEVKEEIPSEKPPNEEISEPLKEEEKPVELTKEVKDEKPIEEPLKEETNEEPTQSQKEEIVGKSKDKSKEDE